MRRLWAFVLRDARISRSYRLSFALSLVAGFVTLTSLFFLARTVGSAGLFRGHENGDYFSFALLGVAVIGALRSLQTSFSARLRGAQVDGSLEVLFGAPLSTLAVVCGLAALPILIALTGATLLVVFGALLFQAHLHVSVLGLLGTLVLSLLAFVPLGLLSAAYTLVFKRGDPFTYALDSLSYLLSGVMYPLSVLPGWLRALSAWLPTTHALGALRASVLLGEGPSQLTRGWGILLGFAAALWPLGVGALWWARRHVARMGTLPQA